MYVFEAEQKSARAMIDQRKRIDVVYEDTERQESTIKISKRQEKAHDTRCLKQRNVPDFISQHELVKNGVTFRNQVSMPRSISDLSISDSSLGESITELLGLIELECLIDEDTERKESIMEMAEREEKAHDTRFQKQSNTPNFDLLYLSQESFSAQSQQFPRSNDEVLPHGSVCSSIASTIDERIRNSSLGKKIT